MKKNKQINNKIHVHCQVTSPSIFGRGRGRGWLGPVPSPDLGTLVLSPCVNVDTAVLRTSLGENSGHGPSWHGWPLASAALACPGPLLRGSPSTRWPPAPALALNLLWRRPKWISKHRLHPEVPEVRE